MTAAAWAMAVGSFTAFLVALQVGPSCASTVGVVIAVPFLASWGWLAYEHERRRFRDRGRL